MDDFAQWIRTEATDSQIVAIRDQRDRLILEKATFRDALIKIDEQLLDAWAFIKAQREALADAYAMVERKNEEINLLKAELVKSATSEPGKVAP